MPDEAGEASEDDLTQIRMQETSQPTSLSPSQNTNHDSSAANVPCATASPTFLRHPTGHSSKASPWDSQPMTKTSSSSSALSASGANPTETAAPSPYGTRSRNKTGAARPNYAEDRDGDTEYELGTAKKPHVNGTVSTSSQPYPGDYTKPYGVGTRRSSATIPSSSANKGVPANPPKDQIPGMSSFALTSDPSTAPVPPPSRKRKMPGGSTAASATSSSVGHSHSRGPHRRVANASSNLSHRETNMLSFDNCQGYLKNGKLKADDGTVLSVNGRQLVT